MKTIEDVQDIVNEIRFLNRGIIVMPKGDGYLLQICYYEEDVDHPERLVLQQARKWYVSSWATETEIVETAFAACARSMQHVVQENFTYKGRRIYSPHFDVSARIELVDATRYDRRPSKEEK